MAQPMGLTTEQSRKINRWKVVEVPSRPGVVGSNEMMKGKEKDRIAGGDQYKIKKIIEAYLLGAEFNGVVLGCSVGERERGGGGIVS